MVDRDLILRKADIDRYLDDLAEFRNIDAAAYTADWKTQRIVERTSHPASKTVWTSPIR